jgi:hypothetical protein
VHLPPILLATAGLRKIGIRRFIAIEADLMSGRWCVSATKRLGCTSVLLCSKFWSTVCSDLAAPGAKIVGADGILTIKCLLAATV